MLSEAENELATRVTGDAPAGRMLRSYWVPAHWTDALQPRDAPVPLRLFGEDLLASRDASGTVSVAASRSGRAYPIREAGGLLWTYLGSADQSPPFPAFDWTLLPREQLAHLRFVQRTNYLQALEGAMDSAHTAFLHRGFAFEESLRSTLSTDLAPRLEAEDTPYGFRYAAIRLTNDPETLWVKTTLFVFPAVSFAPRPMTPDVAAIAQFFVPIDDEHTMHYSIFFSQDGSALDEAAMRRANGLVPGVDLDASFFPHASAENGWNQDRVAMKTRSWCGIAGFPLQDAATQESMGPIVDRSREHLGTTDVAVIRLRRRILENIARVAAGETPIGLDGGVDFGLLRSEQRVQNRTEPTLWE